MSKRIKMKWQKCQTAKQSVFLRIQVRASSQTKGLDDFFTDFEKKKPTVLQSTEMLARYFNNAALNIGGGPVSHLTEDHHSEHDNVKSIREV